MKWWISLVFASILSSPVFWVSAGSQQNTISLSSFGTVQTSAYLSALDASRLQIAKIYPGGGSVLAFIEDVMGTIDAKRNILEYAVNRMHANAVMIMWRRLPISWDNRDQLESPLNSGNLNPSYIKHLDEWVSLAEEYNVHVIFEEWFDPMLAKDRGEWTGFEDTTFVNNWANFYRVLAGHFAGKSNVAGFISGEDVIYNHTTEGWPWPSSGTTYFANLWNQVQTNLSLAVHSADPNFNFIAIPTMDWSGGFYTLGSEAMYPNAWQPLNDPNPHVLYRVMWNPGNWIKTDTHYPFDNSLLNGAVNWRRETGLPITIECLVEWRAEEAGGVWVWNNQAFQWMRDFLAAMKNEGIGLNMGEYWNESEPYGTHDIVGNERAWVQVYSEAVIS